MESFIIFTSSATVDHVIFFTTRNNTLQNDLQLHASEVQK